jgi:hypothetical protein
MHSSSQQNCRASLAVLLVLQAVMLAALFTQTEPHPPVAIPLFALGPFLGASLATVIAAFFLGATETRSGRFVSMIAAVLGLISFGPQKWFDPAFNEIWPAVLLGQLAVVAIALSCLTASRSGRTETQRPA